MGEDDEMIRPDQFDLWEDIDASQCRALWASVLVQACVDARTKSNKPEARKVKVEALAWLNNAVKNDDFVMVCDLAGYDPKDVRRIIKEVIHGEKALNFYCTRRERPQRKRRKTRQPTNKGDQHDDKQQTSRNHPRRKYSRGYLGKSK